MWLSLLLCPSTEDHLATQLYFCMLRIVLDREVLLISSCNLESLQRCERCLLPTHQEQLIGRAWI